MKIVLRGNQDRINIGVRQHLVIVGGGISCTEAFRDRQRAAARPVDNGPECKLLRHLLKIWQMYIGREAPCTDDGKLYGIRLVEHHTRRWDYPVGAILDGARVIQQ